MFYSHEILTSRQHGVATVWLVATLGSKSTLKKVTRKAILDVDVPKACGTIHDPSAPMALRLQGNLLYGVSRVYSQQCGYVLADAQTFHDKMKGVVAVMKGLEIDTDAGNARPRLQQLNLPDDPAFLPDFDMNLDLSMFGLSTGSSSESGSTTPPYCLSSRSSVAREPMEEPALVFPSVDTPRGELGVFGFAGDTSLAFKTASRAGRVSMFEDTGMIEDPGFEFDAEGNVVQLPKAEVRENVAPSAPGPVSKLSSDLAISAQVRREHEAGLYGAQFDQDITFNDAPLIFGDDELPLPDAPPFSPLPHVVATPAEQVPQSSFPQPEEEVPSSAEAHQSRVWAPKATQADDPQELANADLAKWNANYLANMAEATKIKQQHKAVALARKNAAFWVLGQGIAGVGICSGDDWVPNPLAIFSGRTLLEALTGRESSPSGMKRTRSLLDDLDEEGKARRVRARGEDEQELGRGDDAVGNDAEEFIPGAEDGMVFPGEDVDIEIGRHAPESLHGEHSSQMPWNVSVSRHGSGRPFGSGLPGGQGAGMEFGPPSALIGRRGTRLTSASPLLGRGSTMQRYSSLELPEQAKLTSGEAGGGSFDDSRMQLGGDDMIDDSEFHLYGPAAAVDTQTAAQSQWVAAALDTEAHNFLAFLRAEINAKIVAAEGAADRLEEDDVETVTFQDLLPPEQYSKVVAAQGLLHVLSLATKGLIEVKQEEAFGRIEIGVVAGEEENANNEEDTDV